MNVSIKPKLFVHVVDVGQNDGKDTGSYFGTPKMDSCIPLKEMYVQGVAVLPALVALENLFFLLALALYRKKLQHNNVYRYVASALVANFVTSGLGFYHFLNYYHGFESNDPNLWWALRKGMTLALCLIMCGNIGLLIYGIGINTHIVGRQMTNPSQSAEHLSPQFKRRKANVLIFFVWALPVIYGALSMTPWNCTTQCTCTLRYESAKPICAGAHCSRLYTPMAKSYLFVIVILWTLEFVGLMALLFQALSKLRQSGNASKKSLKQTFGDFRKHYGIAFILFGLFFVCTVPVMMLAVIDFVSPEMIMSHEVVNFITPLPFVYCLVSPILLAHKLSGVKGAARNLFDVICSCNQERKKTKQTKKKAQQAAVNAKFTSGNLL